MILEFIISIFFGIVKALLFLVPSFEFPSPVISAFDTIFSLIAGIGYFVPLGHLSFVLVTMFLVYNIKVVMDILTWVIKKIPFIN